MTAAWSGPSGSEARRLAKLTEPPRAPAPPAVTVQHSRAFAGSDSRAYTAGPVERSTATSLRIGHCHVEQTHPRGTSIMLVQTIESQLQSSGGEDRLAVQTRYFDYYRVGSPAMLRQTLRLRFEVYCLDRGFLCAEDYPDGLESDLYDPASVHYLGFHRPSGTPAGTVRVVMPNPAGFPMFSHCQPDPDRAYLVDWTDDRSTCCAEISRILVAKHFRQRAGDTVFGGPPRGTSNRGAENRSPDLPEFPDSAGPEIVAGLYKCIYHEVRRQGMSHLLGAMERSLVLLMRRVYIRFCPIGPEVDYFGPVRPYMIAIRQIEEDLAKYRPEIFRYWMDGLPPEFRPPLSLDGDLLPSAARPDRGASLG